MPLKKETKPKSCSCYVRMMLFRIEFFTHSRITYEQKTLMLTKLDNPPQRLWCSVLKAAQDQNLPRYYQPHILRNQTYLKCRFCTIAVKTIVHLLSFFFNGDLLVYKCAVSIIAPSAFFFTGAAYSRQQIRSCSIETRG